MKGRFKYCILCYCYLSGLAIIKYNDAVSFGIDGVNNDVAN